MHFVLFSVLCSVTVAVMLKYARLKGLDTRQIIIWNYPTAILLTYFFFEPQLSTVVPVALPWHLYVPVAVILPSLFLVLSLSLRYAGLVQTEVAQRISLVISLIAAVFLFQETFTLIRVVGVLFGFAAIGFLINWNNSAQSSARGKMIYPLLVFFGYGAVDILFKLVALYKEVPYTTSMFFIFCGAFVCALLYFFYLVSAKKMTFSSRALLIGLFLGFFNFGNILFYMKAHRVLADNPSIVFTGMNIGVIVLGALIGVLFFKEKLSLFNKIGLCLALVSVMLIYLA